MIPRYGSALAAILLLNILAMGSCGYSAGLLELALLKKICVALEEYRIRTGEYPTTLAALEAKGDSLLTDRWGHVYHYGTFEGNFYLISYGADGAPGGEAQNEDLVATAGNCPVRSARADSRE